jgi:hypothetical protein
MLKDALPYLTVGLVGLGGVVFAVDKVINAVDSGVSGVAHAIGHDIAKLKPGQEALFEAQEALDDVQLPTYTPVVSGDVTATGSLATFKSFPVFGGKIPGTTDGVNLTQTGNVAIMAPQDAVVGRTLQELPGSNTANPKFAATLTVDADKLYPDMLNSTIPGGSKPEVNTRDGVFPKMKYLVFGGEPDGKYTSMLTNLENNYLKVRCAQAMAPLVQAGMQHSFYVAAQQTKLAPSQTVENDDPAVASYLSQIGNRSLPVTVKLVDNAGQPVNPQSFTLKAAGSLMDKQAIAKMIGVDKSDMDVNLSSQCESEPKAVEQQVAIQEGYLSHTGQLSASVIVNYEG